MSKSISEKYTPNVDPLSSSIDCHSILVCWSLSLSLMSRSVSSVAVGLIEEKANDELTSKLICVPKFTMIVSSSLARNGSRPLGQVPTRLFVVGSSLAIGKKPTQSELSRSSSFWDQVAADSSSITSAPIQFAVACPTLDNNSVSNFVCPYLGKASKTLVALSLIQ